MLVDRSPARDEVADGIAKAGGTAEAVEADLETWTGCRSAIAAALESFGRIDILVNNVGGTI